MTSQDFERSIQHTISEALKGGLPPILIVGSLTMHAHGITRMVQDQNMLAAQAKAASALTLPHGQHIPPSSNG